MTQGKSHFDAGPPPSPLPPRLFIFHKSLSKRAQYFGIIGNGSVGQEERGEGKKN